MNAGAQVAVSSLVSTARDSKLDILGVDTALIDDIELDENDGLPGGMRPRAHLVTVRPHEVERGDFLVGLPRSQVDGVLYDGQCGRWLYNDARGTVFASRRQFDKVQVVRGAPVVLRRVRHLRSVN